MPDELQELQELWQRSREKKAQYKKEREEARKLGLLPSRKTGKRKNKFGNRVYNNGESGKTPSIKVPPFVDLSSIADQISAFVEDIRIETLELPPMDKRSRKKVHLIADCYDLKSKSRGPEGNRYTTLIRTSRTGLRRGKRGEHKLNRLLGYEEKTGAEGSKGRLFQRDGDVVGSKAEPIGESNIGFRLLSRMGCVDSALAIFHFTNLSLGGIRASESASLVDLPIHSELSSRIRS